MKIKEKGLTGNAAKMRKESMAGTGRKGFNAFREMGLISDKGGKGSKGKKEVLLEIFGKKIPVSEEDGGSINKEDVPFVKGATLKFDGVEDVPFDDIKVSVCAFGAEEMWGAVLIGHSYRVPSRSALPSLHLSSTTRATHGATSRSRRLSQTRTSRLLRSTSRPSAPSPSHGPSSRVSSAHSYHPFNGRV